MNVIDIFSNILLHLSTYAYLHLYSTVLAHVNECMTFSTWEWVASSQLNLHICILSLSLILFLSFLKYVNGVCVRASIFLSLSQNFNVCANSNEESTFVCKCVVCTVSGATYSVNAFDDPIIEYENSMYVYVSMTLWECETRYIYCEYSDTKREYPWKRIFLTKNGVK